MKIKSNMGPLIQLLRFGGLNRRVRGLDRLLRMVFPIAHQDGSLVDINYFGHTYSAAPNQYVDWEVLITGAYERKDIAVFEKIARYLPSAVCIDVGANVGHHAFIFGALGWKVHAFEPNPELGPIIQNKITAAGFSNITLHQVGLSEDNVDLPFVVPSKSNSGMGTFAHGGANENALAVLLPLRRGDEFVAGLGLTTVDVIKMDIQGLEPQALRGLHETLATFRPIVCVEVSPENRLEFSRVECLRKFFPENYLAFHVRIANRGPFRTSKLEKLTEEAFMKLDGNAFLVPDERRTWIEDS